MLLEPMLRICWSVSKSAIEMLRPPYGSHIRPIQKVKNYQLHITWHCWTTMIIIQQWIPSHYEGGAVKCSIVTVTHIVVDSPQSLVRCVCRMDHPVGVCRPPVVWISLRLSTGLGWPRSGPPAAHSWSRRCWLQEDGSWQWSRGACWGQIR